MRFGAELTHVRGNGKSDVPFGSSSRLQAAWPSFTAEGRKSRELRE